MEEGSFRYPFLSSRGFELPESPGTRLLLSDLDMAVDEHRANITQYNAENSERKASERKDGVGTKA